MVNLRFLLKISFLGLLINFFLSCSALAVEDEPAASASEPSKPEDTLIPEIQDEEPSPVPQPSLKMEVILSDKLVPQAIGYQVQPGDTIGKIASRFHTTIELIKISNHLPSDTIRAGQHLRIWTAPFNIIISKKDNVLILKNGGDTVKIYPVATGTGNNTPVGEFTINSRYENPVWYKKGRGAILPGDPENALGTRWLGFDKPQYGIHGTIHPELIGQQVSHGCVRMHNVDVEELYNIIPLGTKVTITDDSVIKKIEASPSGRQSVE